MENNEISLTTANAVWIATALLHSENDENKTFACKEIFQKVRDQNLVQTEDVTVFAHISTHCVANTKPWPNVHRKLLRVATGRYRLYKPGDDFHPSRKNGQSAPLADEVPPKYRNLIDWYHNEYCKEISSLPVSTMTHSNFPITTIEKEGTIKIPTSVLEKLQLQDGDYLAFVESPAGGVELRKARVQLEVS